MNLTDLFDLSFAGRRNETALEFHGRTLTFSLLNATWSTGVLSQGYNNTLSRFPGRTIFASYQRNKCYRIEFRSYQCRER